MQLHICIAHHNHHYLYMFYLYHKKKFPVLINITIHLLFADVVEASCLLSSDKNNNQNAAFLVGLPVSDNRLGCCRSLNCSNEMASIDTYWIFDMAH